MWKFCLYDEPALRRDRWRQKVDQSPDAVNSQRRTEPRDRLSILPILAWYDFQLHISLHPNL